MAKAIADTTCPGCGKDHQVSIDLPDPPQAKNVVLEKESRIPVSELEAIIESKLEKRMPKAKDDAPKEEKVKEKVEVRMPSWMPGEFCANGSCGDPHKNKHYAQKPKKKCSNCDQFAPAKAVKCAWCKGTEFDDLDDDDLTSMGIPDPEVSHEHEHNHEH